MTAVWGAPAARRGLGVCAFVTALGLLSTRAHADDPPPAEEPAPTLSAGSAPSQDNAQPETPSPSYGQYPPPATYATSPMTPPSVMEGLPGAREHEGLYARLQVGPGAARTSYKERVDGVDVSSVQAAGLSGTFDLTLGGRAIGDLIVHGNVTYSRSHAESRRVDGVQDASFELSTTAVSLGAGVTYYFMPYNVFLGAALGPSWIFEHRDDPDSDLRTKTGVFVLGSAGKEWWVGPRGQWALGAALRYTFAAASFEVGDVASTLKYMDLVLALSMTFN